ncbi:hypothetical protein AA0119_g11779 [Alternaria tenuissima]|uniref:SAM domain-containing protein n=1 Tax=Alternaria tenuissima TaxID=119927 RepID=A0ABY0FTG7_9PLEO|nr:hypothetical protein AA0118_g10389 [Alternaria tenuissima]RYN88523.1 hypothetical protein AA0119_g11779 [Alternaria tenuissima]RYO01200.1 hypothetical protein AA0121_g13258 [Alternaria tenuissima]RYO49462.1 hypothetical protein AA0116_g12022 [Alternaria tenuissima]
MPPQSQKKRSGAPTNAAEAAKRLCLSQRSLSPREALASQATESPSEPAWETQFLESQPEAEIPAPTEGIETYSGDGDSSESFTDDLLARKYDIYNWADSLEIVTLGEWLHYQNLKFLTIKSSQDNLNCLTTPQSAIKTIRRAALA